MAYDDIIELTGGVGKYQRRILFCLCLAAIPSAFHSMVGVFIGATPSFRCLLESENSENATFQNILDSTNNDTEYTSQCEINYYNNSGGNISSEIVTTAQSDAFVYDKTTYQLTTVTEFNLVCNNAWIKATADSLFMVGIMMGALIFGALSDKYGRKPMFCLSMMINFVIGILVAFSPEIISYIIFRMVLGLSVNAMYLTVYVIVVESVVPDKRVIVGTYMQIFFSVGYILTTAFAYFITNWRILQIAITIPSLGFLFHWWLVPESVRWLLTKGRLQEAKALVLKSASVNGVDVSKIPLDSMLAESSGSSASIQRDLQSDEKPSVLDLYRYPNLRKKSLLLFFVWFICNGTYYGLSWNSSNLGGNDYVNFAIAGFVEVPAHIFVAMTVNKWGRKMILCSCLILSGIFLMLTIVVPDDMNWLVILLAMVGKLTITSSFDIAYVFSAEQYPTVIRNVGVGACSTFARIGGIVAPYILYSASFWKSMPYVVFGSGALIAGLLALLLPETLNKKLPESIEDGEAFGK